MIMSTALRSALAAMVLLASASTVTARPQDALNTPNPDPQIANAETGQTFWDRMQRNGN
jgi:hypothetical protein